MPIADIVIAVAVVVSVIVGFSRGFVKEAMSVASLLVAIWAAFNFGSQVASVADNWLSSEGARLWFGRIVVFVVILGLGGLLGWGITKLVRLSVLSGADRGLGMLFGFCRGVVLVAVCIIGGQYASFDQDGWWRNSRLIPHISVVSDWLRVMAPKGVDLLTPEEAPEDVPENLTERLTGTGR